MILLYRDLEDPWYNNMEIQKEYLLLLLAALLLLLALALLLALLLALAVSLAGLAGSLTVLAGSSGLGSRLNNGVHFYMNARF